MYDIDACGTSDADGNVTAKLGAVGNVTETFDFKDQNANTAICAPPIFCGRRAMLCTVGVPLGGVSWKTSVICATGDAAPTVVPPKYPPLIGPSVSITGDVVDDVSVPEMLVGTGVAVGTGVGVGVDPPPGGGTVLPLPPPPPQAASASATEKSKGRANRRWVMRIAFISWSPGCSLNITFETPPDQAERRHRRTFSDVGPRPRKGKPARLNLTVP